MPHTCKTDFWGETADLLLQWLDYLDVQLAPLCPPSPPAQPGHESVCHLTKFTYDSLCILHSAIEGATGIGGGAPKLCVHDANFNPGVEAEFRQVVQVMTALLVADQYDNTKANPHDLVDPLLLGWMNTPQNSGNPEPGAMDRLVGRAPPVVDAKSVLGRIRNSLGA